MADVYLFLVDGFEEIEALMVVDVLRRARVDIVTVSLMEDQIVKGSHNIDVKADMIYQEGAFQNARLFVLPGGPGTHLLAEHEGLKKLLPAHAKEGKMLAALCAAPSVLGGMGLLKEKKATCFPGYETKLNGAEYIDQKVVVDGAVITGKAMGAAFEFSLAIVTALLDEKAARVVKDAMYY